MAIYTRFYTVCRSLHASLHIFLLLHISGILFFKKEKKQTAGSSGSLPETFESHFSTQTVPGLPQAVTAEAPELAFGSAGSVRRTSASPF